MQVAIKARRRLAVERIKCRSVAHGLNVNAGGASRAGIQSIPSGMQAEATASCWALAKVESLERCRRPRERWQIRVALVGRSSARQLRTRTAAGPDRNSTTTTPTPVAMRLFQRLPAALIAHPPHWPAEGQCLHPSGGARQGRTRRGQKPLYPSKQAKSSDMSLLERQAARDVAFMTASPRGSIIVLLPSLFWSAPSP